MRYNATVNELNGMKLFKSIVASKRLKAYHGIDFKMNDDKPPNMAQELLGLPYSLLYIAMKALAHRTSIYD